MNNRGNTEKEKGKFKPTRAIRREQMLASVSLSLVRRAHYYKYTVNVRRIEVTLMELPNLAPRALNNRFRRCSQIILSSKGYTTAGLFRTNVR